MENEITKEYTNGEISIFWKPNLCMHSGKCVKSLPMVFNASGKTWIDIENISKTEVKAQVEQCPSGALSYIDD